jgi:hypothetical protein
MINLEKMDIPSSGGEQNDDEAVQQIYDYAADLLFENNKSKQDVIDDLIQQGLDRESATIVVNNLVEVYKKQAYKNILYGALWCVGGTVATIADIGYIFYGAIIWGAIQFIKGVYQSFKY